MLVFVFALAVPAYADSVTCGCHEGCRAATHFSDCPEHPAYTGGSGGGAAAPVSNRYNIPSTGDNSQVTLWSVLFVGFAVLALVSRKKRKA